MRRMHPKATIFKLRKVLIAMVQIGALYCFALAGNYLAEVLHLNLPGSLIGMGVLFILLHLGIVPYQWVVSGGNWLLAELLLFFIPSVVAVMQYKQLFRQEGLALFLIILIGTVIVMVSSGLAAELILNKRWGKTL
ncbi:MAG: CidA/LrgA family holin-like protein [Desulfosporosinus sp.]|nr:CidA/LrgA family holin-like protein [Desulfosporosinus sp.]